MILYKNTGKGWNGERVGEFIDLNQFSFLGGMNCFPFSHKAS